MSALRPSTTAPDQIKTFSLGDFTLQSGEVLPDAHIAYATFGTPDKPAIVNPTWYSGLIADCFWLIGEGKPLDPSKYFIIVPALFGNGESSAPSNHLARPFPRISYPDNIRAQHQLVTSLGVTHIKLVVGFSMGGQQAYHWGAMYPNMVDKIIPICSSARTSDHNKVFLEGPKSALLAGDKNEAGRKAFGRVWAGWGLSQAWYRQKLYQTLGFETIEEFLKNNYDNFGMSKDPDNLLVMLDTWQNGDISAGPPFHGDLEAAIRSIKAKTLLLPCATDLYFPPEDSEIELGHFASGQAILQPIPSVWGHAAGGQANADDMGWVGGKVKEFLESD